MIKIKVAERLDSIGKNGGSNPPVSI
jgi:hypothetical protein